MTNFEEILKYKFKDKKLINVAMTHSSYANENKHNCDEFNEKLEFLGDAVLELVISSYIFKEYPGLSEGELTKFRASIVCETSLSHKSKELLIGKYLKLGKGEESTGGRTRNSILADAFEAVIGAVYLDSDFQNVQEFILDHMKQLISEKRNTFKIDDYKTYLQELIQKSDKNPLKYSVVKEDGPDHNKLFTVEVTHNGAILGIGIGKSKKDAEQFSALDAINKLRHTH